MIKRLLFKLLPSSIVNRLRRFKLSLDLKKAYHGVPFSLADLPSGDLRSTYARDDEMKSASFRKTMRKLLSYPGAGPVGPKKHWEYPWVLANLEMKPGLKVLDAGCGRDPVQFILADLGMDLTAIDPFENVGWHGIDRRLSGKFGLKINYRVEGMEKISFPDESFDRVVSVSVIEHCRANAVKNEIKVPQTEADRALQGRMMKEMARVLKKGGLLIVTVDFLFPKGGVILESNVHIKNLVESSGLFLLNGDLKNELYGYNGFRIERLMRQPNLVVQSYSGVTGTSIGLIFRK
jgi:ubiquinone/menaquinone biosynthesis C-methylase UbiE